MKSYLLALACGLFLIGSTSSVFAEEPDHHKEHPRIVKAIHDLMDAIKYMEESPKEFNGFKAEAIADARKTIDSLHKAMGVMDHPHHDHDHK